MGKLSRAGLSASVLILTIRALQPADAIDFSRQIQPVFAESCYSCHGPKVQMAGLRLDVRPDAKVLSPGNSANSRLLQRIVTTDARSRMPFGGAALAPEKIELIRKWIDAGAAWPETSAGAAASSKKHWAFIAPVRPAVPPQTGWTRNAIDAFVLKGLEKADLKPSPEADRATLLRRVSLDLIGLPPTPAELDAFLADRSPNAYEKQVDRLLASPALRRAMGAHLAGRGALCRFQRL